MCFSKVYSKFFKNIETFEKYKFNLAQRYATVVFQEEENTGDLKYCDLFGATGCFYKK